LNARQNEEAERDFEQRYDGMKEGSKERAERKGQNGRAGKQESTRTG
jgi:hypothetical protein